MKKTMVIVLIILGLIACGESDDTTADSGNTAADTGNTADSGNTTDTGDTADSGNTGNTGDTGNTTDTSDSGGGGGDTGDDGDTAVPDDRQTIQFGSGFDDLTMGVASDSQGNVYLVGYGYSLEDNNLSIGKRIYLTKYTKETMKHQWTTQWGAGSNDAATDVVVDQEGNVYVTGNTHGAFDGQTYAGEGDVFLTRLNAEGDIQWTVQRGTAKDEGGPSVTTGPDGTVYVTGFTNDGFDGNTYAGGECDIYLSAFSREGTHLWTKQLGTEKYDWPRDIIADASGNIFIVGETDGIMDDTWEQNETCEEVTEDQDCLDSILIKLDSDGTTQWVRQWGSKEHGDRAQAITLDTSGNVYITGHTADGREAMDTWYTSITLTKIQTDDGALQWERYRKSCPEDHAWGNGKGLAITRNSDGVIFVTGYTEGSLIDGKDNGAGKYCQFGGCKDNFLLAFESENGDELLVRQWGTGTSDEGRGVAVSENGDVLVLGTTRGDLDNAIGTGESIGGAGKDFFITKWYADSLQIAEE